MRQLKIFILIVVLGLSSLLLVSCGCENKIYPCIRTEQIHLNFEAYTDQERDGGFYLDYYKKGSNFSEFKLHEKYRIGNDFYNETYQDIALDDGYDYRITVVADSNSFEISNYNINDSYEEVRKLCSGQGERDYPFCPIIDILVTGPKAALQEDGSILVGK